MSSNQSAYMVSTAHSYLRAAKLLWGEPHLQGVSVVNAAIALEILLKSFSADPVENQRINTVSEQYEVKKRFHRLTQLYQKIDKSLLLKLGFKEFWIERFDNLFIEARYPYEEDSKSSYSDVPIEVGIEMLNATIKWYKDSDNDDPWIKAYPNVPGGGL